MIPMERKAGRDTARVTYSSLMPCQQGADDSVDTGISVILSVKREVPGGSHCTGILTW